MDYYKQYLAFNEQYCIHYYKVRLIVSEFAGYTPNLILTGGESLLHPQIEEVLQMTTGNFKTSLLTNVFC